MGGRRGTDNAGGRGTINSEACRMSSPWKLPEVITFYLSALRVPNQAGPPQALCVCVCVHAEVSALDSRATSQRGEQ